MVQVDSNRGYIRFGALVSSQEKLHTFGKQK